MNKIELLNKIANDLEITKYEKENEKNYRSRAIYSALSIWIKVSTLDIDIMDEKIGVSKKHIISRCSLFLEQMIELFPEINEWFYYGDKEEKKNPIAIIRERLYNAGELVSCGFTTDMALPKYQKLILKNKGYLERGFNGDTTGLYSGLYDIRKIDLTFEKRDIENIFEFYFIDKMTALDFIYKELKEREWSKIDKISFELFNKYSEKSFYNCWEREFKIKDGEVTLFRNSFINGNSEYGLIKNIDNELYISHINNHLVENNEVRRYMYGLKRSVGNKIKGYIEFIENSNLFKLKLRNALPKKEESILLLFGWPEKDISDTMNLIFNREVIVLIKEIMEKMNVEIVEG